MQVTSEKIRFQARDGTPLVGQLYRADNPRGAVLMAPATGVLAFTSAFCAWLASGTSTRFGVRLRGIAFLQGKLRDCKVQARVEFLTIFQPLRHPRRPLTDCRYYIGHSADGGQLVGAP